MIIQVYNFEWRLIPHWKEVSVTHLWNDNWDLMYYIKCLIMIDVVIVINQVLKDRAVDALESTFLQCSGMMFLDTFRQLSRRKSNVPRTTGASEITNTYRSSLDGQFVFNINSSPLFGTIILGCLANFGFIFIFMNCSR